jgi:hypothetical protein
MLLQEEDEKYRQRQDTVAPRHDERASSIASKLWAVVGSIFIILMVTICFLFSSNYDGYDHDYCCGNCQNSDF